MRTSPASAPLAPVLRTAAICLLAGLAPGCKGVLYSDDPPRRDSGIVLFLDGGGPGTDAGPRADGGPGTDSGGSPPVDAGGPPPVDAGPPPPCGGAVCVANASCQPSLGACRCDEGFIDMGGACIAPVPGDPATRTEADVCAAWNAGHVENASPTWVMGASACDPGVLQPDGIDDTLRRINMFRWLAGLPVVSHNASDHQSMMECAWMMSANNALSHSPPAGWTCHTAGGASAAGRSNIALGYGSPGAAIDGYMGDRNTPSLGHRRWILGARLGQVELGFAGRGQCLGVFDGSGSSDRPWTAYPNQGFAPIDTAQDTWSFQANSVGLRSDSTAEIVRVSDGARLNIEVYQTGGGGPPPTVGMIPSATADPADATRIGWSPQAGQTYRVTIGNTTAGDITYEVHLVGC